MLFSRKGFLLFATALLLITTSFLCMALDPSDHGLGILSRTIAPPILLAGLLLPIPGIIGLQYFAPKVLYQSLCTDTFKHLGAFLVFTISYVNYLTTLEPTASLWDCSEFIAASYKLQVPHTPGTPLSLLIGRMFSMLAGGDVTRVALTLNIMSATFSALAIGIVYYIISHLADGVAARSNNFSSRVIIIAAIGGSLCLAFSDTFWFSAVEAETYGIACFFMVLLVWIILKGKNAAEPTRSRWLILIAYIAGLAFCIHPMCVLALPVLPFTWYVHGHRLTFRAIALTIVVGCLLILTINRFVSVGIFEAAFYLDLFLVNSLHAPFYTGGIVVLILLVFIFRLLLLKLPLYKTYTWAVVFLLAGFLPYGMLFLRSAHNPPIDEGSPENLSMIKAYMNRESYGTRPLLYGPYFDARIENVTAGKQIYHKGHQAYEPTGKLSDYQYEPHRQTIFPRMYSHDASHIETYRQWTGLKSGEKPGYIHNIVYLMRYQFTHMYLRYFLWNFAGREGDVQYSDWLAPWEPVSLETSTHHVQHARNQYWMIPLILGIIGSIFHYRRNKHAFTSTLIFFLITGVVLVLYLNSLPNEPRERDYIYVGSYIAFSWWIGLGILYLFSLVSHWKFASFAVMPISIALPLWMYLQNHDDHDRSGRTFQIDHARNVLQSCAQNAILFTGGDNDTFPLWYLQEVEGFRTDVRIVVPSYFNTDWYIDQLRNTYYHSKPFKLTLPEKSYRQYGPNDVLYLQESIRDGIDATRYLTLLRDEHPALRMPTNSGDVYSILPSRTLRVSVDKQKFIESDQQNFLSPDSVTEELALSVTGDYLPKNALAFLDLLISNQWERPMYFNFTSLNTFDLDLKPYVVQEGQLYHLLPIRQNHEGIAINTAAMYKNLVEQADYSNLLDPSVYFNHEDYQLRMIIPLQQTFNTLAEAFYQEGNLPMAEKVLLTSVDKLYQERFTPSITSLQAAHMLMALGKKDNAFKLSRHVFQFYYGYAQKHATVNSRETDAYLLRRSAAILEQLGYDEYQKQADALFLAVDRP
jgi:hypothetical protein